MKTIWKYELEVIDYQEIEMPDGAEILSAHTQNGMPCIWVKVDPTNKKVLRGITIHGTGNPIHTWDEERFIGTVLTRQDALVWHIFEVVE